MIKLLFIIAIFANVAAAQWIKQSVETKASLRGLSVVNNKIIWASGTNGTVVRTIDGGANWQVISVPEADKLDFRDIETFDENIAYILSIGNGDSSRIYKTLDGGKSWNLLFKNADEKAFFDAIACWDKLNCVAMSDPVDGKFVLIKMSDGVSWKRLDTDKMPSVKDGEAAFAASGTCLITQGKSNIFLVSGGKAARVFRSNDRGASWSVADTPIVSGTSGSGIFSIAMRDASNGVIVGGNYEKPDEAGNTLAFTADGGKTWVEGKGLNGYRSAVAIIDEKSIIAVGSSGSDLLKRADKTLNSAAKLNNSSVISNNGVDTLNNSLEKLNLNAVQVFKRSIWAVGERGSIVKRSL